MPADEPPVWEGPSWQALVTATVMGTAVRPLTGVLAASAWSVGLTRRLVAGFLAVAGPTVPEVDIVAVDEAAPGGGRVRGEWVRPTPTPVSGRQPDDVGGGGRGGGGVVLYLHGSAFAVASARTHRGITSRLARRTGLAVFACDYRLAPRHRFPSAADDVDAAFTWLLSQGYPPERIVVAGDSAGGHLAVDLAAQRRGRGDPGPAALTLFSPLIDLTLATARSRDSQRRDPMVSAAGALRLVSHYTRGADPDSPRLRFTAATVAGLPPMLVQAGGAEMLSADAEHLAALVRAANGSCELEVWAGQVHVFQALAAWVPEAERALDRAATFLTGQLAAAARAVETGEQAVVREAAP